MRGRRPVPPEMSSPAEPVRLVPLDLLPPCPQWVDDAAREMYDRLAPLMGGLGLLQVSTCETFAAYCQCWSQWKEATDQVRAEGLTYVLQTGLRRLNPAAQYASDMSKQLRAYAAEFGLTPASRGRVGVIPSKEADDLDSFLEASE